MLGQARALFEKQGQDVEVATSLITVAELRLAQGDAEAAMAAAEEASQWFRRQARPGWESIAESLQLQAAARSTDVDPLTPSALHAVATDLVGHGWVRDATRCGLVAAD